MPTTHFVPAPGNYGETYIAVGRTLPTAVIGASATVRHVMPVPASQITAFKELLFYKGGQLEVGGAAVSSFAGAVTARMVKRVTGGTIVPLSASVTITTGTTAFDKWVFPVLTTATQADLTIRPNDGDSLCVEITATSTVTTQPADVVVCCKLAVLR